MEMYIQEGLRIVKSLDDKVISPKWRKKILCYYRVTFNVNSNMVPDEEIIDWYYSFEDQDDVDDDILSFFEYFDEDNYNIDDILNAYNMR